MARSRPDNRARGGRRADLADQVGLDKVTLTALARGFGVKDASLYSHVRNSQDLRVRLALLAAGELADRILPHGGRAGGPGRAERLRRGLPRLRARSPGPLRRHPTAAGPGHGVFLPAAQRSLDACASILRGYGLAEPDLTDAGRLLRATLHGYVSLEAAYGFGHPRPVQVSWEQSLIGLHQLLSNWPTDTAELT